MTKGRGNPSGKPRRREKSIEKQLQGNPQCEKKHVGPIVVRTNRKGDSFNECSNCGAFLGMV